MRLSVLVISLLAGLYVWGATAPDVPIQRETVVAMPLPEPEPEPEPAPDPQPTRTTAVEEPTAPAQETVEIADTEAAEEAGETTQSGFDPVAVAVADALEDAVEEEETPAIVLEVSALTESETAPDPEVAPQIIHIVTGNRVNLRAGPSTSNEVLTQLVAGDKAEVLTTNDAGWSKITVLETGVEGWMAARFLAEDSP